MWIERGRRVEADVIMLLSLVLSCLALSRTVSEKGREDFGKGSDEHGTCRIKMSVELDDMEMNTTTWTSCIGNVEEV